MSATDTCPGPKLFPVSSSVIAAGRVNGGVLPAAGLFQPAGQPGGQRQRAPAAEPRTVPRLNATRCSAAGPAAAMTGV